MNKLTESESKLIKHAKKAVVSYSEARRNKGLYDVIFAFVLSNSGKIYAGMPLESSSPASSVCAEANAIAKMLLEETEKARIAAILVTSPVPEASERAVTPCGSCRHLIREFGTSGTRVICCEYIRLEKGWKVFPAIERYSIEALYPFTYKPTKW